MLRKRDLVSITVMAAIVAVTLWMVLGDGRAAQVWSAMKLAHWPWLALGGGLMVAYTATEALVIRVSLGAMGHRPRYRHCCEFACAGFYFSSVTPSATGGQPAEVFYMTRRGISAAHGALAMLLFTIFHQVASVIYGLAAWVMAPQVPASLGTGLGVLLGYGLTTLLLLTVGMVALLIYPKPVEHLCRGCLRLGAKLHLVKDLDRAQAGLKGQMEEYARGAELIKGQPLLPVKLLTLALVQQGLRFLVPWAVYRALGLGALGPDQLVATQALVYLAVGCLPIPGAVGASEAAFLTAFQSQFGPALTPAAMLLTRGLSFYLPLLVTGAVTAVVHMSTRERKISCPKTS